MRKDQQPVGSPKPIHGGLNLVREGKDEIFYLLSTGQYRDLGEGTLVRILTPKLFQVFLRSYLQAQE